MAEFRRGVFQRFDPEGPRIPLMIDISRSGREYPEEFRSQVPFTTLRGNVSMYVDDLWDEAPKKPALKCAKDF